MPKLKQIKCRLCLLPQSDVPYLDHLLHHLPAERAVVVLHLPRTLLARGEMSARQKYRIDLIFPAYTTEMVFLVCMLELHRSLAESFPLLEFARVDIAMFDVFHPTLTIGFVGCPFTLVAVAIGVFHGALATFLAGDKISIVSIAGRSNENSIAVGSAAFERMGSIAGAKIRGICFAAEV